LIFDRRSFTFPGMDDSPRQRFEKPLFSYAQVEQALATAFGVSPDVRERAFRARLKHFQRLRVPAARPGKGSALAYSLEDAAKWALLLMGAEVGIEPVAMAKVIARFWKSHLAHFMRKALGSEARIGKDGLPPNPIWLTIRPRLNWGGGGVDPDWIGYTPQDDYSLKDKDGMPWRRPNVEMLMERAAADGTWLGVRNLTDVLTKIEEALQEGRD
jgi:hypothetical protein